MKGIIEGFTEFLPISSTGHLILVEKLLPLTANEHDAPRLNALFDLVIQFPAILAIVILFRKRLWGAACAARERPGMRRFWLGLAIGFVPIGIAGLLVHEQAERLRECAFVVPIALIAGGVILVLFERIAMQPAVGKAEDVPLATALSIGVCQCLALIPGISRSGAAIVSGRLMGLNRTAAAEFSFFLALPTMGAACGYKLLSEFKRVDWHADGPLLLVGSLTSFFTAWAVVALFMKLLEKRHGLSAWGWYRIVIGLLVLALGR
ncbi:MAG: undecaprenyl-diphosphate phosphatase [Planctomycetota bacterium]|nr:undecaprenyl-diphosphate phosphatase [Planctomycetota bacterium]